MVSPISVFPLEAFQYSQGEIIIAPMVVEKLDDFLWVRIVESVYTKKWNLLGGQNYQMSVTKSRIVFKHEDCQVTIGRGLLKWYCDSGQRRPQSYANGEQDSFYLEIASDAALGPGLIEIFPMERMKGRISDWVHDRLFPSRSKQIIQNICNVFKTCMGRVAYYLVSCFHLFCLCHVARSANRPQQISVSPQSRVESVEADSEFPNCMPSFPGTPRASVERISDGIPHVEARVETDIRHPSQSSARISQSFRESVKTRRKNSVKRIKSGVTKVVKTLSLTKETSDGSKMSSYKSFEALDECFTIDDDCNYCNEVDYDRVFRLTSEQDEPSPEILDKLDDTSSDSLEDMAFEDHHQTSQESLSMRNSWYGRRKRATNIKADETCTTVGFDSSDDTMIVVDESDIFKVPNEHGREEKESSSPGPGPETIPVEQGQQLYQTIIITPPSEATSSSSPELLMAPKAGTDTSTSTPDSSDFERLPTTSEMACQTRVSNPVPRSRGSSPTSGPQMETPDEGSRKGSDAMFQGTTQAVMRLEGIERYVDKSQSLMSLRTSSKVGSAIKKFDHVDECTTKNAKHGDGKNE